MGEEPGAQSLQGHSQLQHLVQEQCRFFDGLADLIDPKYFYSNDNETVNLRFMKHSQRAATKSAFKEQKKKNKRAKLDPDAAKTTTELQQAKHKAKQTGGSDGSGDDSSDDEDGTAAAPGPGSQQQAAANVGSAGPHQGMLGQLNISSGPAPSRDELMERLRKKLEAARHERHAEEQEAPQQQHKQQSKKQQKQKQGVTSPSDQAKEWRRQQLGSNLKPKPHAAEAGTKRKEPEEGQAQQQQQQQQQAKRPKPAADGLVAGQTGLVFSKLEVDGDKHKAGQQRKRKPTKEQILKAAEEKQQRLAEAQAQPEVHEVVRQEAWQSALQRARGEKVLDDPRLLRRSIKREHKLRERSAKKWQDRTKQQQSVRDEKQQRRKTNLQARVTSKIDKKKAKRDKKLLRAGEKKVMRAGFEGRKDTFIRPGAKSAGGGAGSKAPSAN